MRSANSRTVQGRPANIQVGGPGCSGSPRLLTGACPCGHWFQAEGCVISFSRYKFCLVCVSDQFVVADLQTDQ